MMYNIFYKNMQNHKYFHDREVCEICESHEHHKNMYNCEMIYDISPFFKHKEKCEFAA